MPALPGRTPAIAWVAWLGGAAFVGSLLWFLYAYFVRMGRPAAAPPPPLRALLVNVALFSVFALHHSLLARSGAKRALASWLSTRLERTVYVWTASLLFVAVCWWWQPLPGALYRQAGPAAALHWGVVLGGLLLTARSAAVIDPLELAGIRQARGEIRPATLEVRGPYRLVRHPIYLGWFLMVFGVPDMTWTRFVFATVSSAYLVVAIPFEERSMRSTFGDAYRRYERAVKWRIAPGIW